MESIQLDSETFIRLAIGLGLGLLVGLQRERAARDVAGIRTFPLITMLGFLSVLLADQYGGWVIAAALVSLAAFVLAGNMVKQRAGIGGPSITTEVATLLMFSVGGGLAAGLTSVAVVLSGVTAVLLHVKRPLHNLAERIGEAETEAVFRLALIGLVILPVMPNRTFGPYDVLNPFNIWLIVVLIVGISLLAYVAARIVGGRRGLVVAGLLGGLISSTATTAANARESRTRPSAVPAAFLVILLASTVVFVRVLLEIGLVAPTFLREAAPPLLVMMAINLLLVAMVYVREHDGLAASVEEAEPPTNLQAAIVFGLLYAVVLLALAAAQRRFGISGVYAVAALSGLTDMDAITVSTSQLVTMGLVDGSDAWRAIIVGYLANMAFKTGIAGLLGSRRLFQRLLGALVVLTVSGLTLIAIWP